MLRRGAAGERADSGAGPGALSGSRPPVPAARREILDRFQERAYQSLPYVPVGQYAGAFAVRKNVLHSELLASDVPSLWMLSK